MLGKFILRLFFKCCFHFFVFPTEQIASALYCDLQASISIEQGIPLSLYVARKQEEETSGLESIMRWDGHVTIDIKSTELKKI